MRDGKGESEDVRRVRSGLKGVVVVEVRLSGGEGVVGGVWWRGVCVRIGCVLRVVVDAMGQCIHTTTLSVFHTTHTPL